jgi:hypothetical protein
MLITATERLILTPDTGEPPRVKVYNLGDETIMVQIVKVSTIGARMTCRMTQNKNASFEYQATASNRIKLLLLNIKPQLPTE